MVVDGFSSRPAVRFCRLRTPLASSSIPNSSRQREAPKQDFPVLWVYKLIWEEMSLFPLTCCLLQLSYELGQTQNVPLEEPFYTCRAVTTDTNVFDLPQKTLFPKILADSRVYPVQADFISNVKHIVRLRAQFEQKFTPLPIESC